MTYAKKLEVIALKTRVLTITYFYHRQTKFAKVVFTGVCLSTGVGLGLCPGEVSVRRGLCHGDPLYSNEQAVCILLNAFLSRNCIYKLSYWFSFFTTRKPSLGQGNVLHQCVILFTGGTGVCANPPPQRCRPPWGWADPPGVGQTPSQVGQRPLPGWADPPPDTVNKRAVRILLECILVPS